MYLLIPTTRFKKDLKKFKRDFPAIRKVLKILETDGVKGIPKKMKPHVLKGKYSNNWECHIKPDRLIIWIQNEELRTQNPEPRAKSQESRTHSLTTSNR